VLAGHEPFPAIAVNRWRESQEANSGVAALTVGCAPDLFSISTAVDTATDVTVEELAIETFCPPMRPRPGHSSRGCP
jgi:hypothetical protein